MSEKRKISVRKIMQVLVTFLVTGACVTAMLSASRIQDEQKLKGYDITIKNDRFSFVDKNDITNMLVVNSKTSIDKISIGKVDAHNMERIVNANPWVETSQVFVDNNKMVHVNVVQRVPVARLFDQAGNSYYLDRNLKAMPLSDKYTHYTTVVTNVPVLKEDSLGDAIKAQIVAVVEKVEKDSFWSAQVSQIMFTDDRTFELVPVLGNQRILIGDTTMLDEKFDNLFAFYKKVLNRIGWDKYEVLDVRYKGQVVASPAIAWKIPVDKAVSNMNWVKSIIGNDIPDSGTKLAPAPPPVVAKLAEPKPATSTAQIPAVAKPQVATTKPVITKPAATKTTASVIVKPANVKPAATQTVKKSTPAVAATPTVKKSTPSVAALPTVKKAASTVAKTPVKKTQATANVVASKQQRAAKKNEVRKENKKIEVKKKEKKKEDETPKPKYLYQ